MRLADGEAGLHFHTTLRLLSRARSCSAIDYGISIYDGTRSSISRRRYVAGDDRQWC